MTLKCEFWQVRSVVRAICSVSRVIFSGVRVICSVHRVIFSVARAVCSVRRVIFPVVRVICPVHRDIFSVVRVICSVVRVICSVVRVICSVHRAIFSVVRPLRAGAACFAECFLVGEAGDRFGSRLRVRLDIGPSADDRLQTRREIAGDGFGSTTFESRFGTDEVGIVQGLGRNGRLEVVRYSTRSSISLSGGRLSPESRRSGGFSEAS